jgi:hypothetical protein
MRLGGSQLLLALVVLWPLRQALGGPCDPAILPSPVAGSARYQERAGGLRCEGIYVARVSGTPVQLVSLTRGLLSYDLGSPGILMVALANGFAAKETSLRATGIPDQLFYQMDAILGDRAVAWPVGEVLKQRQITPDNVGVYAFRKDAGAQPIYLPVDVALEGTAPQSEAPIIATLRAIGIAFVQWRFVPEGRSASGGYTEIPVRNDRVQMVVAEGVHPIEGQLQLRWSDPVTGELRVKTFRIGD